MNDNYRDMLSNKIINSLTVVSGCAQLAYRVDHPEKLINYFNEIVKQMDKLLMLILELYKSEYQPESKVKALKQNKVRNNYPPLILL